MENPAVSGPGADAYPGVSDRRETVSPSRGPLIFLAAVLLALLPLLGMIAWPFLTPFILAAVLAIVVNPVNRWMRRRLRPGLSALVTTLGAGLLLALCAFAAGFAMTRELAAAYDALNRRSLEEGGWAALVTHTADRVVEALSTRIPMNREAIRSEILDRMKGATEFLLANIGDAVGGLTATLFTVILSTIFLYFLLRYGSEWVGLAAGWLPLNSHATARLFRAVEDSVIANVNGVMAVAVAQGFLLGICFWLVGLRSPVLWGAIGGAASIVPFVGSPLVWVPVVAGFIVVGSYGKALFVGLWGALVVGSIDNVLRSVVVGARAKLHPVLVALAVFGGTYAFGVLGILMGPLVVAVAIALVQELQLTLGGLAERQATPPIYGPGDEQQKTG